MAIVKCAICGQSFNREKVKCVRHGTRRYAHYDCYPEGDIVFDPPKLVEKKEEPKAVKIVEKKEEPEKEELKILKDYIQSLFGKEVNWPLVMKQIKNYVEENNFSYSGIRKSLHWFYDIQKNPLNAAEFKKRGLALIPFIYNQAYDYYAKLHQIEVNNQGYNLKSTWETVTIKSPRASVKTKKLFNLDEED